MPGVRPGHPAGSPGTGHVGPPDPGAVPWRTRRSTRDAGRVGCLRRTERRAHDERDATDGRPLRPGDRRDGLGWHGRRPSSPPPSTSKVAVVERGRVGGDCLWTGCVPSKALLAAGKVAHHMRTADDFGIAAVRAQGRPARRCGTGSARCRTRSRPTDDNPDRYRDMGVDIVAGARPAHRREQRSTSRATHRRTSRRATCCSAPAAGPSSRRSTGSHDAGFVTSENLFELDRPARVVREHRRRTDRGRDGPGLHPARHPGRRCCRRVRASCPATSPRSSSC